MPMMPMMFFDPTMLLVLPAFLLAMWAQMKVKTTYARFSRVANRAGLTGADVAKLILDDAGLSVSSGAGDATSQSCGLECIGGSLTDHYDPRSRTLRLSQDIYHGRSVAALGIAAHEVGHAIQHARLYSPLMLRNMVYPVCSLGSTLAFPLFFIGLILPIAGGQVLMQAGIWLFAASVFFTLVTLPVEFNASRRALKALSHGGYLSTEEMSGARKVLTAAALTYVAAAAVAIMNLIRLLIIADRR